MSTPRRTTRDDVSRRLRADVRTPGADAPTVARLAALAAEAAGTPAARRSLPVRRGALAALTLGAVAVGGLGTAYAAGVVDVPWTAPDHSGYQQPADPPSEPAPSHFIRQTPSSAPPATSVTPGSPGAAPRTGRNGAGDGHAPDPVPPPTPGCPVGAPCTEAPGPQGSPAPQPQDDGHGHVHATGPGSGTGQPTDAGGSSGAHGSSADHPPHAHPTHAAPTHVPHAHGPGKIRQGSM